MLAGEAFLMVRTGDDRVAELAPLDPRCVTPPRRPGQFAVVTDGIDLPGWADQGYRIAHVDDCGCAPVAHSPQEWQCRLRIGGTGGRWCRLARDHEPPCLP